MTVPQPAPENVFEAIAKLLKPEQREYFYQRMMYFRHLRPEDEVLRIAEAMGFLAVVIREAPWEMAKEREQLAELLTSSMRTMQASHQASMAWQTQMESRMAKLPEEIARGINADSIAAKLSEGIRQQFQQTGLPAVAEAMSVQATTMRQASRELTAALQEFAHPSDGAILRVGQGLRMMKADLQNASEHIRAQMNGLGKQLNWTIAVFCSGTLADRAACGQPIPAVGGCTTIAASTAVRTGRSIGAAVIVSRDDAAESQETHATERSRPNPMKIAAKAAIDSLTSHFRALLMNGLKSD